jgi:hypothetical protein
MTHALKLAMATVGVVVAVVVGIVDFNLLPGSAQPSVGAAPTPLPSARPSPSAGTSPSRSRWGGAPGTGPVPHRSRA